MLSCSLAYVKIGDEELIGMIVVPDKKQVSIEKIKEFNFDTHLHLFAPCLVVRNEDVRSRSFGTFKLRLKFDLVEMWFLKIPKNQVTVCFPAKHSIRSLYEEAIIDDFKMPIEVYVEASFKDLKLDVDPLHLATPEAYASSWKYSLDVLMNAKTQKT